MSFHSALKRATELGEDRIVSDIFRHAGELIERHAPSELSRAGVKSGDDLLRRAYWSAPDTDRALIGETELVRLLTVAEQLSIKHPAPAAGHGEFFYR